MEINSSPLFTIITEGSGYPVYGYRIKKNPYTYGYLFDIVSANGKEVTIGITDHLYDDTFLEPLLKKFQDFQMRSNPNPLDVLDLRQVRCSFTFESSKIWKNGEKIK
jgi:hypothetical protein